MIQDLRVRHREYSTARSFEEVVTAFELAVGTLEDIGVPSIVAASRNVADFEARIQKTLGPSGFTRFFTADHGAWLTFIGQPAEVRMYTIGNPLIAITMLRQDIRVGLNVPVRVTIYRDVASGTTRFGYDEPSTLMSGLNNKDVTAAAEKLDAKLATLAEQLTAGIP